MKKILSFFLFPLMASAQTDSLKNFTFSAYGELYYSYDSAEPANHEKPAFIYNHKRHNEVAANLILLKANYSKDRLRANLGAMAGNYAHYNLSAEPTWAQFIYEANAGVKISKEKNLWLDAGIMPSHIGFESAVGTDNPTLTRSLVAENSPYYETGVRLSYTNSSGSLYLAGLFLNGWQKIQKPEGMQKPAFGAQITYKPSGKILLNYSNFFGSDKPDSEKNYRTYHNLYAQITPNDKLAVTAGVDIGTDSQDSQTKTWVAPVVIGKFNLNEKSAVALRAEYFSDKNGIIIPTGTENGFQTIGLSANYDLQIMKNILFRVEAKNYNSKDAIFTNGKKENWTATTALCVKL